MNDSRTLFDQIQAWTSPEFGANIVAFLAIVEKVRRRELTPDAAEVALQKAGALPIVSALAGKRVEDDSTSIDFGAGNTMGNITVGDSAGRDVIKLVLHNQVNNYYFLQYVNTPPGSTPSPEKTGWDELFVNGLYKEYQLPFHAQAWVERVLIQPGCYVVEAPAQYGKTALIRYLWQRLQNNGCEVIGYIFSRYQQRSDIVEAIRQIRSQFVRIELIGPDNAESPSIPWWQIEQNAAAGRNVAILIDALDESQSDEDQRLWLDRLLPTFQLEHIKLVVTSREPLSAYHVVLETRLSETATLRLKELSVADIGGLARQLNIRNRHSLYKRVFVGANSGEPVLVAAILKNTDPEFALKQPTHTLREPARIAALELEDMKRQADANAKSLLERLVALLAVSPTPLTFGEIRDMLKPQDSSILERLCKRLARSIKVHNRYMLANPIIRAYILQDAEKDDGHYAGSVGEMRKTLAGWFRDQYQLNRNLKRLSSHILLHLPSYLLVADEPEQFSGQQIFTDKRWRDALDTGFDSLIDLRAAVTAAWWFAEQHTAVCTQVLGVTTCALMITSLIPVFPPEAIADLVRRDMITREQAQRYAHMYASQRERSELLGWLREPAPAPHDHPFTADFDHIAKMPQAAYEQQLNRVHRKQMRLGTQKPELLLKAVRDEYQNQLGGASNPPEAPLAPPTTLHELIARLRDALADPRRPTALELVDGDSPIAPLGLTAQQGPSGSLDDLLNAIAEAWEYEASDLDVAAKTYCEITRLIATDSRSFYCDALIIFAPVIGRVFGKEYLERIAAIVEAIMQAYP